MTHAVQDSNTTWKVGSWTLTLQSCSSVMFPTHRPSCLHRLVLGFSSDGRFRNALISSNNLHVVRWYTIEVTKSGVRNQPPSDSSAAEAGPKSPSSQYLTRWSYTVYWSMLFPRSTPVKLSGWCFWQPQAQSGRIFVLTPRRSQWSNIWGEAGDILMPCSGCLILEQWSDVLMWETIGDAGYVLEKELRMGHCALRRSKSCTEGTAYTKTLTRG